MRAFLIPENTGFSKKSCHEIASFYREYLTTDILKNWAEHTPDITYGGYITNFDRKWNIQGYDKGAWGQARHIYTFSMAYQLFNRDKKWIHLAETGIEFIKKNMYDNAGRTYYLVDRTGREVKEGTISIFGDAFFLAGLAQYIDVTGKTDDLLILQQVMDAFDKNIRNSAFKDISPYLYEENVLHHAVYMIALNAAFVANTVLKSPQCTSLIQFCIDKICTVFLDKNSSCIIEKKKTNGEFCSGKNSHLVNVGHTYECLWFLLDVAVSSNNDELLKTICAIVDSTEEMIKKSGRPLLFSFALDNNASENTTWKYESTFKPTDNVSWTYAETLCLFGYLAAITKEDVYFKRFIQVHNLIQEHFIDKEYGDWFHALDENYAVIKDFKGSLVKTAFHTPRALMKLIQLFERK